MALSGPVAPATFARALALQLFEVAAINVPAKEAGPFAPARTEQTLVGLHEHHVGVRQELLEFRQQPEEAEAGVLDDERDAALQKDAAKERARCCALVADLHSRLPLLGEVGDTQRELAGSQRSECRDLLYS